MYWRCKSYSRLRSGGSKCVANAKGETIESKTIHLAIVEHPCSLSFVLAFRGLALFFKRQLHSRLLRLGTSRIFFDHFFKHPVSLREQIQPLIRHRDAKQSRGSLITFPVLVPHDIEGPQSLA